MSKAPRPPKLAKPQRIARETAAPRSRTLQHWLGVSFTLTLGTLLVLAAIKQPLGQGYFIYRYSPVREWRTLRATTVLIVAALAAAAVWRLALRQSYRYTLLSAALLAALLWIFCAPPSFLNQQAFNLRSLSSDGAFVIEAEKLPSVEYYLSHFPRYVQQRTAEELGGTRVLSNPPGATVFAWLVLRAFPPQMNPPGWLERWLVRDFGIEKPANVLIVANSLKVAAALAIAWALAAVIAFFLGRLFLSPAGAAVFAIVVCFNPATVHFVPGKDPAQLLTINLMLLAWFAAWLRRSSALAALAGAMLVVGLTIGLIHFWVALAVYAATAWEGWSSRRPLLLKNTAAAIAGALVGVGLAKLLVGWNIPATLLAVYRRFSELQQTFHLSRPIWFLIGLPSFLLFLSPGFWALAGLRAHRRQMGFGARIALCTGAVMMLTYLLGVTYELPRLWVAFLPPLTLGLAIDLPLLRCNSSQRRAAGGLVVIVIVQIVATALHWTVLDAREAEYRLSTRRYFH